MVRDEGNMKRLNLGSCIFLMGISVLVGYMSLQLGIGRLEDMGPGFMPLLASVGFFLPFLNSSYY